jgi:hypothetical protein
MKKGQRDAVEQVIEAAALDILTAAIRNLGNILEIARQSPRQPALPGSTLGNH